MELYDMRKFIVLVLGLALAGSGLYILYMQMFESRRLMGLLIAAGGFLLFCGAGLIHEGFVVGLGPSTKDK